MAASEGRRGGIGGISLGGIIVIIGIVLMIVWSFWIGLIIALIGRLLEAADPSRLARVHLTVQEERAAARGLYESLGFHTDASIRGYRGMWTVG